ncbi:MAG: hypothetical protein J6V53_04125 [Alphaproteobacteria bacterium]|nr:hypothetical protein [Alphaproteobacteria bacterium]
MKRFLALCFLILCLCFLSYQLGKSHSKIKIIEKEVEVIRYETKTKEEIYMRPNASRDALLKLMRAGAL